MHSPTRTFRFNALPREIRDKIYRELLCDFKPLTTSLPLDTIDEFLYQPAKGHIDAAIMRTNKAIYSEAYEVLIKTNRFVKITSEPGLPLRMLTCRARTRVVSWNKQIVENFKGYLLSIHLGNTRPYRRNPDAPRMKELEPCTLMVLHRDMNLFCTGLLDGDAIYPDFSQDLRISISVAPVAYERQPSKYSPSMAAFISIEMQETLLAPFRVALKGYKSVKIEGKVDSNLAATVKKEMEQNRWSDADKVLSDLAAAKEKGALLYKNGAMEDAFIEWADAAVDIDRTVASSSWSSLVEHGGERFVAQVAELYFHVRLNAAHVQICDMQKNSLMSHFAGLMAEDALKSAVRSIKKDYWKQGYKYQPSNQHLAKFLYRYALLLRLQAEPSSADRALKFINSALGLQPGDPVISKERDNITAWLKWVS